MIRRLAVILALVLAPVEACQSIGLVNWSRSSSGGTSLPLCPGEYAAYAEKRAIEITTRFEHRAPRPGELPDHDWRALGENIGRGPNIEDIHARFMESPTHRDTAMAGRWSCATAGAVRVGRQVFVAQVFVERASLR